MKRKAFGFLGILLVIFQLFSPWAIGLGKKGISVKTNVASARNIADVDIIPFFHDVKDGEVTLTILTSPSEKITDLNVQARKKDSSLQLSIFNGSISNLPTNDIKDLGIVSLNNSQTVANLYLRTDYVLKNKDFKEDMVADISGFDSIDDGNLYVSIGKNGVKNAVSHNTANNQPESDDYDKILEKKSAYVPFVSVQNQIGDDFDASWGMLSADKLLIPVGGATTANLSCGDGSVNLTGDKEYGLTSSNTTASPVEKKIKFAQNDKEYKYYEYLCTTRASKNTQIPKTVNGVNKYTLNFDSSFKENVSLAFDIPITGKYHSWKYLNDQNDNTGTKKTSCVVDYCLDRFQVDELIPTQKDGKVFLEAKISIFLADGEKESFDAFVDKGTDKGKADEKDDPGSWKDFLNSGKADDRPAKEGNGFYAIWGEKDGLTISDSEHSELNLNEYLFGDKMLSPIILGKSGVTFYATLGEVALGKTYYVKIYGSEEDTFADDDGYSPQATITIPSDISQITQTSRDGVIAEEGDQLKSDPAFLPTCGLGFWPASDGSLTGCLIHIFYWLVFKPTAFLLGLAGQVLDFILVYSISPEAYKATYIIDSWKFVRDVCNLFFIFMLIYLAFKIILNIGHGTKQLIVNTLIIATVINFSYPLTTIVIDISNITARQLYYNAFERKDAESNKPVGLSATAAGAFNPQKIILDGLDANPTANKDDSKGTIFMILLMGVIFNIIAIFMFLKIALQFIYRILGLIFAIILSPFAVFSYSLDGEQRKKLKMAGFDSWFNGLMQDAFKAPVFLFFVLIMTLFVANNPFKSAFGTDVNGVEWWMSIIIPFMLIMAFLGLITSVTKSMSSSLATLAGEGLMKGVGAVAGIAAGGIGLAGAGLIGKGATALANSNMGQRIMDRAAKNNGLSGFIARQQARALRGMQTGSYDLRQNRIANAISAETGANFNLGASAIGLGTGITAGGYMAAVERRNKKRDEFVQMLEWNKNLMNEMKERKAKAEDSKAEKETLAKDQRAALAQSERDLKQEELNKKEVDERIQLLEKLEELFAKRADAIATGKPVAEIDLQINRTEDKLNNGNTTAANSFVTRDPTGAVVGIDNTRLTNSKAIALGTRDATKDRVDSKKTEVETAKDNLKTTEDSIRELDKDIQTLTKAIKKVKEDRKNGYNWRIRNKSGHIFKKATYGENKDGTTRTLSAEESRVFANHYQGGHGDFSDQMRNIITSVDEHSHEVNNAFNNRVRMVNTALGALAGAFTGGAGAIAVGALAGGVVGIARSYRPDNEHYGVPHEEGSWHPHAHDNYRPPSGGGGGGGHGGGHDDHGGHH